MNMTAPLRIVFKNTMQYLTFARPTESELDRVWKTRREISEKLTLTDSDRELIKDLDRTIEMLSNLNK